mmetsp:Transcript_50156/g.57705  ORF Transcript_50156/g.57705 Transcript_50156/m.57705 type:complete len:238 (+) Transcript_50156:78-791(+)
MQTSFKADLEVRGDQPANHLFSKMSDSEEARTDNKFETRKNQQDKSYIQKISASFNFSNLLEEGEHHVMQTRPVKEGPSLQFSNRMDNVIQRPTVKSLEVTLRKDTGQTWDAVISNRTTTTARKRSRKTLTNTEDRRIEREFDNQDQYSVAWLNQSNEFDEDSDTNNAGLDDKLELKVEESTDESVIQFSARNYNDRPSFIESEAGTLYNKTILESFIDSRNLIYVFNTNANKRGIY